MASTPSKVQTANEILLERAIRHSVYLARFRTQVGNEMVGALEPLLARVFAKVTRAADGIQSRGLTVSSKSRRSIQNLLVSLSAELGITYRTLRQNLGKEMRALAKAEGAWQTLALRESVPGGIGIAFTAPKASLLNSVVDGRPMILGTRSGFVKDFFDEMPRSFLRDIEGTVNAAMRNGETTRDVARRLTGTRGSAGVLGKARRDLLTVSRTVVNHVGNQARELAYASNPDVVKGVKFIATLDARTSGICRSLDGDDAGRFELWMGDQIIPR